MVEQQPISSVQYSHLNALDGFRACLALWVYLGHLAAAVGFKNYFLDRHALAVDLFMVLSGFLMVHTWKQNGDQYRFFSKATLAFYCARFFRIAPLYYFLLLVCYLMSPSLAQMHDYSLKAIPPVWAANIEGYSPNTSWNFEGFNWIWLHLTFLFGLVPGMENSTPLPDWSLSLEMQFYLVLPILLICLKKVPLIVVAIACAALALTAPKLFGNYLDAGLITHFGQPSFLPYRLNAFMAGMILAFLLKSDYKFRSFTLHNLLIFLSALLCIFPLSKLIIIIYIFFALLVFNKITFASKILSIYPMKFLGNISYSIYLSHILIVIPTSYLLIFNQEFTSLPSGSRFLICLFITAPLVFIISFLMFAAIEKPSVNLGRFISKNFILNKS
jgi:peptidoglycan/LPS O-acetylase OafA/YrhL